MRLSDFDFELPEALIALRPVEPRSASKLLVQDGPRRHHAHARDLATYLRPGDMLVFNDTRVIPARLFGTRLRDDISAKIEITLIEETNGQWEVMAKPARKLRPGDRLQFDGLSARVDAKTDDGRILVSFDTTGPAFFEALATAGVMPLPPYIAAKRAADQTDLETYQTIFAQNDGAIAAPTASLHFDAALLASLEAAGILTTFVTLHVGIGTFLPVKADRIEDHVMHSEWGEIPAASAQAMNAARAAGGRIIPVGTTALRLIETAAAPDGHMSAWSGDTDIFITPGYRFKIASGLMTNFHLPKSTLMMLVSALMGQEMIQNIYQDAIEREYRFFSYGDASLLLP